ncbi:MAG: UPF0182 family protein [Syntrophobacterales bacterium]|jgi:uncharacterized membrane protein (UPF0182 family)|nr:UPF0182 family protein [Syntrophobacterales bacterium]
MIRRFGRTLLIISLFVAFLVVSKFTGICVDWLFFNEVGFEKVFIRTISAEILTGLGFGLAFFIFVGLNALLACRGKTFPIDILFMHRMKFTFDPEKLVRILKPAGLSVAFFGAWITGLWGSSIWVQALSFFNSINTGTNEPVFGHDIGFYLFRLPMWEHINGFSGFLLFFTILVVVAIYAIRGSVILSGRGILLMGHAKVHLAVLVLLFFIKLAFGFYLERFDSLYSSHSIITGAGYSDIYGRLVVLKVLMPLTILAGLFFAWGLYKDRLKAVIFPTAALIFLYITGTGIYPALLQNFRVAPSELALEEPFIKNHIELTRYAYNLNKAEVVPFDVSFNITAKDISNNEATIKNIRLWDESPLLKTYSQLQQIRTYYRFHSIDNDRYTIGGEYRQVLLSARELSYDDLPSKSWVNEKLVFTHGNGIVMGYASRISKEGLPEFIVKDIPPVSAADVKVSVPEIYYGELTSDYVIVNTKNPEFSYPTAKGNVYASYKGSGGISLDSLAKRLLFAVYFQTVKIPLTAEIRSESRILYNRNILNRIDKIAPFLLYDSDPYVVISDNGKVYWMIDAYTMSHRMPYAKPLNGGMNYMRNSVKVTVDAYDGKVDFYLSDPEDAVAKVVSAIFPGFLKPMSEMPAGLREHIRYPKDLFKVQTSFYSAYHMNDPKVFYNKEDLWEMPRHGEKPMEPYYLIMKLPEEKKEEYVLLMPYTPAKRDNLAAWFAARCDEPNYGKLLVFNFPKDRLIFGPRQVDARIDQDSFISQQLTLWGQRGSQVIRGSLQIIPVDKSLLYIQPLFLAAEDKGGLPELRRVIAAYENNVVMEENLEQCLISLFGSRKASPSAKSEAESGSPPTAKASLKDLARETAQILEKAKAFQRQGDWAGYGEQLKKLEQALKQMSGQ